MDFQQAAATAPGMDPILAAFQVPATGGRPAQQDWAGGGASEQADAAGASGSAEGEEEGEEGEEGASSADDGAVDDPSDSDFDEGEAAEEEKARSGRGRGPRARARASSDEDSEMSDPDYDDGRGSAKRHREPTPPGARRSVRIKVKGIDPVHEVEDEPEPEEPLPRRGLRSLGPVAAPPSAAPSAGDRRASQGEQASRAGSEAPGGAALKPAPAAALGALPNPKDIRRELSDAEMAAELAEVRGMWELAATLDFFNLFRKQINLSRTFAAAELEHVLAYSDGRDGLLADLHIDIMRGISPKQEVPRDSWQIHLGNKIKYHWRPLLSGLHCPFKPDKYFEAYQYARLPASDRLRALHFLCTIRCDREDIQFRVAESYLREWTKGEVALVLQAQAEAVRAGRPEDAPQADFSPDVFRRAPNGLDAAGRRYYVFSFLQSREFRMYRDTPASVAAANGEAPEVAQPQAAKAEEGAAPDAAVAAPPQPATAVPALQPTSLPAPGQAEAAAAAPWRQESWDERWQRLQSYQVPPDPEAEGRWELVATTLEEFQDFAARFGASGNAREAQFSLIIRQYVVPVILQQREEEERRAKAAERVQRKLGVPPPLPPPVTAAGTSAGAAAGPSGSGGSGAVAGGGSSAAADGGREPGGRSRRARARVNYAFSEYDQQLRSAIRTTQRGESDSDEEGGRRRRRRVPSPTGDPVEAARGGLRRGRSAAAIKEDVVEVNHFVDERQLRAAVAHRGSRASSRAASRAGSGADLAALAAHQGAAGGDTLEGSQPQQSGGTAEAPGSGPRGGGRGAATQHHCQPGGGDEEEEEEEEASEPDAGAEDASEDEYVPSD